MDKAPLVRETASPPGLTSYILKIVAIVGMTFNHAGYIFYDHLPFEVLCVFLAVGGLTFPIMAFLLVEGYRHTSSVRNYAARLGITALLAQIPYGLFLNVNGNVLFTLLIGLAVLYLGDRLQTPAGKGVVYVVGSLMSLTCDWGFIGVIMIILFKVLHGTRGEIVIPVLLATISIGLPQVNSLITERSIAYLPFVLYPLVGCSSAIPLLASYRGQRGRPMKYFFYAYYPLHILILGLGYFMLFGTFPTDIGVVV